MFLCSVLGWFGLAQLDGLVWLVSQNSGGEDEALHKPLLLQRSGLSTSLSCHSASWCNLLFLSFSHSAFRLCTRSHNSCTSSDRLALSSLLSKRWCRHFYLELRHDVQQVGRLRLFATENLVLCPELLKPVLWVSGLLQGSPIAPCTRSS